MSEQFRDDAVALRRMLAESGYEVTIPRLLGILEETAEVKRNCEDCVKSNMGLCWGCLVKLVEKD